MEVLIFEDKNWVEITYQDNPTFDYFLQDNVKVRKEECIIVMKVLPYEARAVSEGGYCVIHVPLKGDVIRRGLFWNLVDAKLFADTIAQP
jgi:hypothetical protein